MPIKSILARREGRRGLFRRKPRPHGTARVVIRKPASWSSRLIWGGLIGLAAIVGGTGLFLAGQYNAGHASIESALRVRSLSQDNQRLIEQANALSETLATTTTQLHIEQGARKALEGQMLKLEEERTRLTHDLALFDNLFPSTEADGRPGIRGFRIEPASATGNPRDWRYRLLIMRAGKPESRFVGTFQLQVRYQLNGKEHLARGPETGLINSALELDRYQRIEGRFQAPDGAKLLGAVARVMENGRPIAESVFQP